MKFGELLPIGSVVLLKDAHKKIVIVGIMPIKHMEDGSDITYDYMGVPYPEGYMGTQSGLLFNHESIQSVIFQGFSNEERDIFVEMIQRIVDQTEETVNNNQEKNTGVENE